MDPNGKITRVNQALLDHVGVGANLIVGRSLTGLKMDPDPRISINLMHKLLTDGTVVASARAKIFN